MTKEEIIALVEEKVNQMLEEKGHLILGSQPRIELKANQKIVVLAETEEEGKAVAEFLKQKGFLKVEHENVCLHSSEMVAADLVVLSREYKMDSYKMMNSDFINKYIHANWEKQKILYFGPYDPNLDTKTVHIGFANYREKLEGNIMQMLETPSDSPSSAN